MIFRNRAGEMAYQKMVERGIIELGRRSGRSCHGAVYQL